ncbi:MAG: glycosyltransferase family 9 protein [Deltaproteobacteria bacterium]|jgi:ADP-heptose:LPS heptosyltransferase|nr:glycosyltransferase family 9 protein [Deltaproteobacteria bacterium]
MSQETNQQKPILILQMQRMGDLVLSYPLCAWLASVFPGAPIWMVGEKIFFEGLLEISPSVTYFDYADSKLLLKCDFGLIINLSHRREAAILAGRLNSQRVIGPYIRPDAGGLAESGNQSSNCPGGILHIGGAWQLYRSSITSNNRHNLFHWADLNALDLISQKVMLRTDWPLPGLSGLNGQEGRVGLFVGASEPDKRPDPPFWAGLASRLIRLGAKPVLLGGQADKQLATEAATLLGSQRSNLCGKFSIKELCLFMQKLDLLIVPDTGPMHLAAWLGVPVLNLSMGPVNAWETGPTAPGHLIMRSSMSCTGCWQCRLPGIPCKRTFTPDKVARVAEAILQGSGNEINHPERLERFKRLNLPGASLWLTERDENGLFNLHPLTDQRGNRLDRSRFWKQFFLLALGRQEKSGPALDKLAELAAPMHGPLGQAMLTQGQALLLSLNRELRNKQTSEITRGNRHAALLNPQFWQNFQPIFRPLSSYTQLSLQNAEFSKEAFAAALENLELFVNSLRK